METDEPLTARARNKINADEVWLLTRPSSDSKRVLFISRIANGFEAGRRRIHSLIFVFAEQLCHLF